MFLYGQIDIDDKQLLKQIANDNNAKMMEIESDKAIFIYLFNARHNTIFLVFLKHLKAYPLGSYLKTSCTKLYN